MSMSLPKSICIHVHFLSVCFSSTVLYSLLLITFSVQKSKIWLMLQTKLLFIIVVCNLNRNNIKMNFFKCNWQFLFFFTLAILFLGFYFLKWKIFASIYFIITFSKEKKMIEVFWWHTLLILVFFSLYLFFQNFFGMFCVFC